MKLTKELCEAVVAGYLLGAAEKPIVNGNGHIQRSPHQRRRGRPPKVKLGRPTKEMDLNNRGWETVNKKRKYTKRSDYWKNPVKD